jgi:O-methyltransferase
MAFVENKLKVIIFGAGGGGRNLTKDIEERRDPIEIIAYADNDTKLQGAFLFDKPIIHPSNIASYDYDQIIIAAMDTNNITNQLSKEYGVKQGFINGTLFSRIGNNNSRITALKNTAQLIYENHIEGAAAELGVFQGDFAKHINTLFPDRRLYLFDTFEGFSETDIEKEKEIGTKRVFERSYNYSGTSVELVMGKMKNPEKCIIRKGFFPETAKGLESDFAFVSLDADLYQPMLEGLKYFYPRLARGGFIYVHDFFSDTFTGTKEAVMEYTRIKKINFVPIGDDCSIGIIKT